MSRQQLVSLAAAFVTVVALVAGSAYWLNTPSYRVLYADMDPESAASVAAKLKAQNVAYRLADGGRTIEVPQEKLDELRLDLAAQGLPTTGRIGFEIFDRTQFGATEFIEQVNYRRALEGEIARTIATIQEVASARVHIAMAKPSIFADRQQPAKASVVLRLRNAQRPLSSQTVSGIASLVAASVEGLRPESVVVVDAYGRSLARPADGGDEPLGAAEMDRKQRVEHDLETKVVSLLEPVVGADKVRANVSVRLNVDAEEQTEERWDTTPVVRSEARTVEGGPGAVAAGLAGARANLPGTVPPGANQPDPATQPAATTATTPAGPYRTTETRNYEISKVVRHTARPRGDVARVSVAVMVDDVVEVKTDKEGKLTRTRKPRDPAELQKLQTLVSATVGIDQQRGDQLTIENVSFEEHVEEEALPPTMMQKIVTTVAPATKIVVVLLVALLAFVFFVRPLMKRVAVGEVVAQAQLAGGPEGAPAQLPRTIAQLEGEIEAQLDAKAAQNTDRRLPVLTKRLHGMTNQDPEAAARLVRSWLIEDRK